MKKIVVAIDGYSSSGKSTMARELARRVGYVYVDSGAMYRAVTLYALEHGMIENGKVDRERLAAALPGISITFEPAGADGVQHTLLNGRDVEREIRDMQVSENVSRVAEIPEVRERLVRIQQEYGVRKGIVMDGRDIGTTVFPQAEIKLFMTADPKVRARRRYDELTAKGERVSLEEIECNVRSRDYADMNRAASPLRRAEDAIELDNSRMTVEEQMEWFLKLYAEVTARI